MKMEKGGQVPAFSVTLGIELTGFDVLIWRKGEEPGVISGGLT